MTRVLLDTNICIDLIRGGSRRTLQRFRRYPIDHLGISSITFAELRYGAARSADPQRNLTALAHFCAPLQILPFDSRAASTYGSLRTRLERLGTPIGALDTLIAAHALALNLTLVTSNQREFSRVPRLEVANWKS